ncbi:metallophosphoesterase [Estrella lausannensis]|uniref:Serine/threonine specific protein phosphatases domain-containing protein n=1 Tax=Estrella lausannensis TaxID=483423 RepID=A0A0H5DNQ0_9BACT|nr:metallophosphoesterase [Estrella lausannensis]CRX37897.1 conserved hypothetical protein [Estrella lausannensis]
MNPISYYTKNNLSTIHSSAGNHSSSTAETSETRKLVTAYDAHWDAEDKQYLAIPFNLNSFEKKLQHYTRAFPSPAKRTTDYGFIQKIDVAAGSTLFVRADLHGDLRSLLMNLKTLQEQGVVDENFKCQPGVHLIGGSHSLEVLELLTTLHLDNPDQVTLIRGNHENLEINDNLVGFHDTNFQQLLFCQSARETLEDLYHSLPLTVYVGQTTSEGKCEYVQFTHGMFELYIDPSPLLDSPEATTLNILKSPSLKYRIKLLAAQHSSDDYPAKIANEKDKTARYQLKQQASAHRIMCLHEKSPYHKREGRQTYNNKEPGLTAYNWGDMGEESQMGELGARKWRLSPDDVKCYLNISSDENRVKFLFRGHEHFMQHHSYLGKTGAKTLVSTMPVGMEGAYKDYFDQPDTAYILTTAPKVSEWKKRAYVRYAGEDRVEISSSHSLRDCKI